MYSPPFQNPAHVPDVQLYRMSHNEIGKDYLSQNGEKLLCYNGAGGGILTFLNICHHVPILKQKKVFSTGNMQLVYLHLRFIFTF